MIAVAALGAAAPGGRAVTEDQVREVAANLRCVVCQSLSVADSPSETANQMRAIVRERLAAGETPEQVTAYFVEKYGTWILLAPPRRGFNLLVWVVPFAGLALGLVLAVLAMRRWSAAVGRRAADRRGGRHHARAHPAGDGRARLVTVAQLLPIRRHRAPRRGARPVAPSARRPRGRRAVGVVLRGDERGNRSRASSSARSGRPSIARSASWTSTTRPVISRRTTTEASAMRYEARAATVLRALDALGVPAPRPRAPPRAPAPGRPRDEAGPEARLRSGWARSCSSPSACSSA